jgi:hypothetical protein
VKKASGQDLLDGSMNIDLHHDDDCPLLLACADHDKSLGSILIETRTMSFDDVDDDCDNDNTTGILPPPSLFHSSPSKAKSFFLFSFPPRLRRRTNTLLHYTQHAAFELASRLKRVTAVLSAFGGDISRALVLFTFLTCIIIFGVHFSSFQHLVIIFLQWIRTLGMMGGVIYIFVTAISNLVFIPSTPQSLDTTRILLIFS